MPGLVAPAWAGVLFLALVLRGRWTTEAGFSASRSAFTYPLTAYAGARLLAHLAAGGEAVRIACGLDPILATLIAPPISFKS